MGKYTLNKTKYLASVQSEVFALEIKILILNLVRKLNSTLVKDWKFGLWQVFGLLGRRVYFEVLITV